MGVVWPAGSLRLCVYSSSRLVICSRRSGAGCGGSPRKAGGSKVEHQDKKKKGLWFVNNQYEIEARAQLACPPGFASSASAGSWRDDEHVVVVAYYYIL
eukprot:1424118-Pleurochrysis_carterae.AAC.5